jgi:hypothetical protein
MANEIGRSPQGEISFLQSKNRDLQGKKLTSFPFSFNGKWPYSWKESSQIVTMRVEVIYKGSGV